MYTGLGLAMFIVNRYVNAQGWSYLVWLALCIAGISTEWAKKTTPYIEPIIIF